MLAPPQINIDKLLENKPSKFVYNFMSQNCPTRHMMVYAHRWYEKLDKIDSLDIVQYINLFKNIYKTTRDVKLRNFQYRLLLNKVFTNDILYKWGKVNTNTCEICNDNSKQTTVHLLYECKQAQSLWKAWQSLVIPYCQGLT